MPPRVVPVPDSPRWDPNVPDPRLTYDEMGYTQLTLRPHADDPDQSRVIIEWSGTHSATIGYPNDEGLSDHPLYHHGLSTLLWMGEVLGDTVPGMRRFILPLKEDTVDVTASDWLVRRVPSQTLLTIGYWGGPGHPELPDPHDFVDESWDPDDRWDLVTYLELQPIARAYMGYSPCRICGINNGALELTDGTYIWPDGLVHYVRDHAVRLPRAFVQHVERQRCRWEDIQTTTSWWLSQFADGNERDT